MYSHTFTHIDSRTYMTLFQAVFFPGELPQPAWWTVGSPVEASGRRVGFALPQSGLLEVYVDTEIELRSARRRAVCVRVRVHACCLC